MKNKCDLSSLVLNDLARSFGTLFEEIIRSSCSNRVCGFLVKAATLIPRVITSLTLKSVLKTRNEICTEFKGTRGKAKSPTDGDLHANVLSSRAKIER